MRICERLTGIYATYDSFWAGEACRKLMIREVKGRRMERDNSSTRILTTLF